MASAEPQTPITNQDAVGLRLTHSCGQHRRETFFLFNPSESKLYLLWCTTTALHMPKYPAMYKPCYWVRISWNKTLSYLSNNSMGALIHPLTSLLRALTLGLSVKKLFFWNPDKAFLTRLSCDCLFVLQPYQQNETHATVCVSSDLSASVWVRLGPTLSTKVPTYYSDTLTHCSVTSLRLFYNTVFLHWQQALGPIGNYWYF